MQNFLSISESPEQSYAQFKQKNFVWIQVCRLLFSDLRRDRASTWNAVINCGYKFGAVTKNTGKEIAFLRVPEPCPAGHLWSLSATWRLSISPSRENSSPTQLLNLAAWCWWNQWCWKWKGMRGSLDEVGMSSEPGTGSFWRPPLYVQLCTMKIMRCEASLVTGLVLTTSPDILRHLHFGWGFYWFSEREKEAVFHRLFSYQ